MDFAISKQQRELQERAAEAVARVVEPIARAVPEGGKLGHTEMSALYRGLAPLGYLGSTIPEAEGGAGLGYVDYGLLLGAFGLSEDAGVERCWRDARMLTVIDGASGIQRLIVGRETLGMAAFV